MPFAAALSTNEDTATALDEVCGVAREHLGAAADLAMIFVSPHHRDQMELIARRACDTAGTTNLLGCTGESIVGGEREVEGQPAVALWLARSPGAVIVPFHLDIERTPDGVSFTGWPANVSESQHSADSALLMLADPFSFPADVLIERLNEDSPGLRLIGGMASGGWGPEQNRLILGQKVLTTGAVAALVSGSVRVRSVVSQGCRPVGRPFVITKSDRNVILELAGQPAMTRLQEVYETLNDDEKALVRRGLHVGQAMSEYQDKFGRGDFLVRNVIGADPNSGAIALGDYVRTGQTVQFHIRDAQSADEDLRELLRDAKGDTGSRGALLFTCNGRGTRLFPEPDHDARVVQETTGGIPLAGFFAQGEMGPVGKKNFLHGFTASIALFESR
jgi:small ligand-binding sensory domain FIST